MIEILAGHQVGREGQCWTIQEDSCQELAFVVTEKISTEGISMKVTIFVPCHRTVVDSTPCEDDLVRIIPRDEFPTTGGWIDNIAEKIDHLVSLLTQADDIPCSRQGWVHLSALKRYDGPAVPSNQDPHTTTILYNRPFTSTQEVSGNSSGGVAVTGGVIIWEGVVFQ